MKRYTCDHNPNRSITRSALGHEAEIGQEDTELEAEYTRYIAVTLSDDSSERGQHLSLQWCSHILHLRRSAKS
jgi:hypothetical protein